MQFITYFIKPNNRIAYILHEGATDNEFGTQMESTSICKYQQTVHECCHVHVLAKPATFVKSTQALQITKVYNNLTQTCSTHKHVSVALKSHSTPTYNNDLIGQSYPI